MRRPSSRPLSSQNGRGTSTSKTRSAPTGGINAEDPIDRMRADDALDLVNIIPGDGEVYSRPGRTRHCDLGTGKPVRRILEHEFGGYHVLVAASSGTLFDASNSSARVIGSGYASDYWSASSLSGRMLLANGCDGMFDYNGLELTESGFTGLDLTQVSFVHVHKGRVMVIRRGTQQFWYGGPNAIAGTLNNFDLSTVGNFGGNLLMLLTISRDGGNGPNDYLAAIFESGDTIIYSGSNPGDPENWAQVGRFRMSRPLSRFAACDIGDDIMLLTERGYESTNVSISLGKVVPKSRMISKRVQRMVTAAIRQSPANDAWQLGVFPNDQLVIVQVPRGNKHTQHVMHINTKKWCRFEGCNASAWGRYGTDCYIGDEAGVIHFFGGDDDDGEIIRATAITAPDYFDYRDNVKHHKIQKPTFIADVMPDYSLSLAMDFESGNRGAVNRSGESEQAPTWGDAYWDEAYFGRDKQARQTWIGNGAVGYASSCILDAYVRGPKFSWTSITYLYQVGGVI